MSDIKDEQLLAGTAKDEVAFDYVKNPDFRMVFADGAVGGMLPSGLLHFALYGERPAIPRRQVHKIDTKTGRLGSLIEEKTITRGSIVREMACDVVMTVENVKNLANWLLTKVDEAERLTSPKQEQK